MDALSASPRTAYPSDLTDEQWRLIDPLLPADNRFGRQRTTNLREVVNAINYRDQVGCAWRMLPHDFPPWGTVYRYFRRWNQDGTLAQLRDVLQQHTASPQPPSKSLPTPSTMEQSI